MHKFVKVWIWPWFQLKGRSLIISLADTNIASIAFVIHLLYLHVQIVYDGWNVFRNAWVVNPFWVWQIVAYTVFVFVAIDYINMVSLTKS